MKLKDALTLRRSLGMRTMWMRALVSGTTGRSTWRYNAVKNLPDIPEHVIAKMVEATAIQENIYNRINDALSNVVVEIGEIE